MKRVNVWLGFILAARNGRAREAADSGEAPVRLALRDVTTGPLFMPLFTLRRRVPGKYGANPAVGENRGATVDLGLERVPPDEGVERSREGVRQRRWRHQCYLDG